MKSPTVVFDFHWKAYHVKQTTVRLNSKQPAAAERHFHNVIIDELSALAQLVIEKYRLSRQNMRKR